MNKSKLRHTYKLLRKSLSESQIEDFSLAIANQLLTLPIWDFECYHLFLSITEHNEVNTDYILNILSGKDKHIVISKSDFSTLSMSHYLLTDNTKIKKNAWHIPEPIGGITISTEQIDVVFVPLLAFDCAGHRVGYGKGFYDKFLKECKPESLKIGLSFFKPESHIFDVYAGDISLDYCVTPTQIYKF